MSFFTTIRSPQKYFIFPNYNGTADLLLNLQITPDYYPYQFKKHKLYDYLIKPQKYIIKNSHTSSAKAEIYNSLEKRFKDLLQPIKEYGPSLWNDSIYSGGLVNNNTQFWQNKKSHLFFAEQFILDDYDNFATEAVYLQNYDYLVPANFRASRDPYTIFGKEIFEKFAADNLNEKNENKEIIDSLKDAIQNPSSDNSALQRNAKFIKYWNKEILNHKLKDQFTEDNFYYWIKNFSKNQITEKKPLFFPGNWEHDKKLSNLYTNIIFKEKEIKKLGKDWKSNYSKLKTPNKNQLSHHPALEQAILPGESPNAEGSQRDNMVYLFQIAFGLEKYNSIFKDKIPSEFKNDIRIPFIQNAFKNSINISKNFKERLTKIRDYFKEIKVVDEKYDPENNIYENENSKTLSIVTYPPKNGGGGNTTIQTISKFPFIFYDLGLKQPLPLNNTDKTVDFNFDQSNTSNNVFNIDDNGWWWNLGNANFKINNMNKFFGTSDTIIVTITEEDWQNVAYGNFSHLSIISSLKKDCQNNQINANKALPSFLNKQEYYLWNEGLRSPLTLNLLLDQLINIMQRQYAPTMNKKQLNKYSPAMDWGDYWEKQFIFSKSSLN